MLTETLEPPTMVPPMIAPPIVGKPKEFNWLTTLEELVNGREASDAEYLALREKACHWTTCACGDLCSVLPRHFSGQPMDHLLTIYGLSFYDAVLGRDWRSALAILHRIERRTCKLLNAEVQQQEDVAIC